MPLSFTVLGAFHLVNHKLPQLPYDDVRSAFIRSRLREGDFNDGAHRNHIHDLIYIEWFATWEVPKNCTGLSRACAAFSNYTLATVYPEEYDTIRKELEKPTRAEYFSSLKSRNGSIDWDLLRDWAQHYRAQWELVQETLDEAELAALPARLNRDRPSFPYYRFPPFPYPQVQSTFIREEIERGSFDDLEYRQYVNELMAIEHWTRGPYRRMSGGYPPVHFWVINSRHPDEFDIIRAELGASTRADITDTGHGFSQERIEERLQELEPAWRTVERSDGWDK